MRCCDFIEMIDKYISQERMEIIDKIEFRVHADICVECRDKYLKKRIAEDLKSHEK